jgi:hypothetical protein
MRTVGSGRSERQIDRTVRHYLRLPLARWLALRAIRASLVHAGAGRQRLSVHAWVPAGTTRDRGNMVHLLPTGSAGTQRFPPPLLRVGACSDSTRTRRSDNAAVLRSEDTRQRRLRPGLPVLEDRRRIAVVVREEHQGRVGSDERELDATFDVVHRDGPGWARVGGP